MKAKEKNKLIKWAETLTDEELLKQYYDAAFDSLGSLCDTMYDMGYEMVDILERREYEKHMAEVSSLLGELCCQRGLELWKQMTKEMDW